MPPAPCVQRRPQSMLDAKELPTCQLSRALEARVHMSLNYERQARATKVHGGPGPGALPYTVLSPGWDVAPAGCSPSLQRAPFTFLLCCPSWPS